MYFKAFCQFQQKKKQKMMREKFISARQNKKEKKMPLFKTCILGSFTDFNILIHQQPKLIHFQCIGKQYHQQQNTIKVYQNNTN